VAPTATATTTKADANERRTRVIGNQDFVDMTAEPNPM
jgi:hypothetical protein